MIYDLHTHSNASDGILSPEALVSRAKLKGVTHLALTDHDTTEGLARARVVAENEGLTLINGIEISTQWLGRNIHVVGLNVVEASEDLQKLIELQRVTRIERAREIGRRLAKMGVPDAYEGAFKHAEGTNIGRPHFGRYLIETGHATTMNGAFKKYLGAGKAGDVKEIWPSIAEACAAILAAGGVPVLAHPMSYDLTITKLKTLVAHFKEVGGLAIEVLSGKQDVNATRTLCQIATQFELHGSCGSDFHVPDQPWQELGCFGPFPAPCQPVWQLWTH